MLAIANNSRTFSSWHQALMLRPGIYQVTAEARVEGAMPREGGANIAISTYDGIQLISNHLQGTTDWRTLSFFLVEDRWGDTTELLCQLGVGGLSGHGPRVISQYQSDPGREHAAAGRGEIRSARNPRRVQGPAASPGRECRGPRRGHRMRIRAAGIAGMGDRRNIATGARGEGWRVDDSRRA